MRLMEKNYHPCELSVWMLKFPCNCYTWMVAANNERKLTISQIALGCLESLATTGTCTSRKIVKMQEKDELVGTCIYEQSHINWEILDRITISMLFFEHGKFHVMPFLLGPIVFFCCFVCCALIINPIALHTYLSHLNPHWHTLVTREFFS